MAFSIGEKEKLTLQETDTTIHAVNSHIINQVNTDEGEAKGAKRDRVVSVMNRIAE